MAENNSAGVVSVSIAYCLVDLQSSINLASFTGGQLENGCWLLVVGSETFNLSVNWEKVCSHTNQSTNHPIIQSANQSANHPINQSSNQPIIQSTNHPINQSPNQPITQPSNHPIIQPACSAASQAGHSISQSYLTLTGATHAVRSISQSTNLT
jgi:hypothetical protein